MWINPETPGSYLSKVMITTVFLYLLTLINTLGVQYENAGDIVGASSETSIAMATDQTDAWQHVAFVFDNDLKRCHLLLMGLW